PVSMLLSGPAGGVVGARHVGQLSGFENLVTVDIGGTSCDVALVKGGKPLISREGKIGSYRLRMSMVDVNTVGAGGGSLVWRDQAGGLHVGPESAGADPGPICYGRGGKTPTVTDASLVLGFLNPNYFAGGGFTLDLPAARAGIGELAKQFEMSVEAMAAGIHRILNERMANEIRLVSVKRGHDPRQFALTALGGAGPVHGGKLAELLSISTMIVPRGPGVLSAFGLLVSNIEHEQTRTLGVRMESVDPQQVSVLFRELDELCASKMAREESADVVTREVQHFVDIRYVGQSYELELPMDASITTATLKNAESAFHALHKQVFGYVLDGRPTELINLRTVHTIEVKSKPKLAAVRQERRGLDHALKGRRPVYFDSVGKYQDTPVYNRDLLPMGETLLGPAIIEQADTTTVLYPGHSGSVDEVGNLIVSTKKEP